MNITADQAKGALFEAGDLKWMLKPEQLDIYNKILACKAQKFVINSSRRLGKSYLLCLIAEEYARQHPDCNIKYAAPTQKMVRDIIRPLFNKIHQECPQALLPKWMTLDSCFIYPNGAKVAVVGCDLGKADRLRGQDSGLCLIDEAGMVEEDLDYIIKDIIVPQTLTIEKKSTLDGKIILASTPPKTPAHPFVKYMADAEASHDGNYVKKTIWDNSAITKQTILDYAKEAGCVIKDGEIIATSTTFRREYLAQVITEESLAICPEFNENTEPEIVGDFKRPSHFDCYVSMDVALIDFTAVLFAYYDFAAATLVIEDEWCANYKDGLNTKLIADNIKNKEKELWGSRPPYIRVMDNNLIVCQDLNDLHQLTFFPTDKDDKEAAVNSMRLRIFNRKLVIHPRCTGLRAHLKYGIWNKQKTKFERSGEYGHFDYIDALVYLERNLNKHKNPFPQYGEGVNHGLYYISPKKEQTSEDKAILDIFTMQKSKEDSTIEALNILFGNKFRRN